MTELEVLIDEHSLEHVDQDALEIYYENIGEVDEFEEAFQGVWSGWTDEAAVGYYLEDSGIYDTSDVGPLGNYIDWDRFGRDCILGGDVWCSEIRPGMHAIFLNL
jgi:hypothetical protein